MTSRHIVTAAHCVHNKPPQFWQVVAGEWHRHEEDPGEQIRQVESIVQHPSFKKFKLRSDIALVTLKQDVTWSQEVAPVCLPNSELELESRNATLVGWGYTEEQMTAPTRSKDLLSEVPMYTKVPINKCQKRLILNTNHGKLKIPLGADHLCAGYPEGGHDGCQGDSGGPLTVESEGASILIGVVSWGIGCGKPKMPGIYTRVDKFTAWIQETIERQENITIGS